MAPNPALPYAELISRLDLPQKVRLLTGASGFSLHPEPRIGLEQLHVSDGPTGVRGLQFIGGREVALLPNATLLASTWDPEVLHEVGALLADEARGQSIGVVLGPTINLHRSPLGGRLFEAFSEDPYLTGVLAAAYVAGLQDNGVGACPKHLIGNESETQRNTMNSVIDEQTLREVYLLPFEIVATRSHPWSMMAAYNDLNGTPATENGRINTGVLRDEWDWDGVLISDWFATTTVAPAANGGLDLVMPGPDGPWGQALVSAVEAGEVSPGTIDAHLSRLLVLADRAGCLGSARSDEDVLAPTSQSRREQLTLLAARGMTVLTNHEATLPLTRDQRLAVIGRHALETIAMGGGSAQVNAPHQVAVAEALTAAFDQVEVMDGVEFRTRPTRARSDRVTDPQTGQPGVRITHHDAEGRVLDSRHSTVAATTVAATDADHVSITAALSDSGPVLLGASGVGDFTLTAAGQTHHLTVPPGGDGFAEDLLAPPGVSVLVDLADDRTVTLTGRPGFDTAGNDAYLGLIARPAPRDDQAAIDQAAAAAARADVAVVVVGLSEEQETESLDKSTLALPGRQDELVRAVAAVAPRTVVVINAATPVLMPWLGEVSAVLVAGLPGQEAGAAVAAALLGDVEPAGRLVTTWPRTDAESAAWTVTPDDAGDLVYREGRWIGHRAHHAEHVPAPEFWFGHGLGYGQWEYDPVRLLDDQPPRVQVTVHNTSDRDSREIVQLYLDPARDEDPVRLVGWQVVAVPAGERVTVEVAADPIMLRTWRDGWVSGPVPGTLLVARGLGDVRGRVDVGRSPADPPAR